MDFKLSFNTDLDPLNIIKKKLLFYNKWSSLRFPYILQLKKAEKYSPKRGGASEENMTKLSHSVAVHAIFYTREMSGNN